MGQPRQGSALKYGLLWAAGLMGFFGLMTVFDSRIFTGIGMVAWTVFWYAFFYRAGQRKKRSPPSRF